MHLIYQPWGSTRLGDHLKRALTQEWTHFRAAVAFIKRSGTRHIVPALRAFAQDGDTEIIVGIDHQGSSLEGLRDLLEAVSPNGRIVVFHNTLHHTFHPKVYLFRAADKAEVIIGSGNLTEGGLYTNYEASVRIVLDLTSPDHVSFLRSIDEVLDQWSEPDGGTAKRLDSTLLHALAEAGLTPTESTQRAEPAAAAVREKASLIFASNRPPSAPPIDKPHVLPGLPLGAIDASKATNGFVMTLQQTDVGYGQSTAGTSRRSPEIFIPLAARNANPHFWGWPDAFTETRTTIDRTGVRMRMGNEVITVNMMCWKVKRDFRLRHEKLRAAARVGDILRVERAHTADDFEYDVQVVRQANPAYEAWLQRCTQPVRNSQKLFGYYTIDSS